jgi:hypothetical protein
MEDKTVQVQGKDHIEGSLGARTMMQMLHSAYDLQESMEYSEFQLVMEEAKQWVEDKQMIAYLHGTIQRIKDFLLNTWNRVNDFALPHGESEELPDKIQKIPQPVLTRWWYVGVAAAFLKKYFQIVLRATQICININDSKSCPNKIASGLQSMMKKRHRLLGYVILGPIPHRLPVSTLPMAPRTEQDSQEPWLPLSANPCLILSYAERSCRAEDPDQSECLWRLWEESGEAVG